MKIHISRKNKAKLKSFYKNTKEGFKEVGKEVFHGAKEAGKAIIRYAPAASRGFGTSARMIEQSFEARVKPGNLNAMPELTPRRIPMPMPYPVRNGYLDLRNKPRPMMRKNPFAGV